MLAQQVPRYAAEPCDTAVAWEPAGSSRMLAQQVPRYTASSHDCFEESLGASFCWLVVIAGNENAGPAGATPAGANSSELLPTPGMAQGTDATPMGPGNMRTRVSSYLPTPVSACRVAGTSCGCYVLARQQQYQVEITAMFARGWSVLRMQPMQARLLMLETVRTA
jgi:hypothetical protein